MSANVYCNDSVTLYLQNKRIPLNTLQHSSVKMNGLSTFFTHVLHINVIERMGCQEPEMHILVWFDWDGLVVFVLFVFDILCAHARKIQVPQTHYAGVLNISDCPFISKG